MFNVMLSILQSCRT